MAEEAKKTRNVTPRSETHQAVLDATHAWCKIPSRTNYEELCKAMLAHKRYVYGENVAAL